MRFVMDNVLFLTQLFYQTHVPSLRDGQPLNIRFPPTFHPYGMIKGKIPMQTVRIIKIPDWKLLFYCKFLILFFTLLVLSCRHHAPEPSVTNVVSNSRKVHVNGETQKQIVKRWGEPNQKLRENYQILKLNERIERLSLPAFDEQWIYTMHNGMGWRVIYFDGNKVSLCVEEWSCL